MKNVSYFSTSKIKTSNVDECNYISTENMISNRGGITNATSIPATSTVRQYLKEDILVSNIRPYFKKIWFATKNGGCSTDVLVLRSNEKCIPKFLYYVLSSDDFFDFVMSTAKGTKMPRGDKNAIMDYLVPNFSLNVQEKIVYSLNILDKKIEINKKINHNLTIKIFKIKSLKPIDFLFNAINKVKIKIKRLIYPFNFKNHITLNFNIRNINLSRHKFWKQCIPNSC